MRGWLDRKTWLRTVAIFVSGIFVASFLVAVLRDSGASGEVIPTPAGGSVTVTGRGNGHGHGMSQYGAEGAAIAGLSATQILAFYYPGTTAKVVAPQTIRVLIGDAGSATTVAVAAGLTVTGVAHALPTSGYSKWRLVPSGAGFALQGQGAAGWLSYATGLPARADFSSSSGVVRLYNSDQTSTDYRGTVGAIRNGAGEQTINRLPMDSYVEGVVPRESPASWKPAALQAQAVAARSYAADEVRAHASSTYDICDNTNCQVYGGKTHYAATGAVLYTDDPAALTGNANEILTYGGVPILAQYSASNGGATADGGEPYLVAKTDPYDDTASGDPYLGWTKTVAASSVASHYGLASVSQIEITARDGFGQWGGRVAAGFVDGVTAGGVAQRIATTGPGLASALGVSSDFFDIQGGTTPSLGHLDLITQVAPHTVRVAGWAFDPTSKTTSTQVDVYVGPTLYATVASGSRHDVQTFYKLPGSAHGYDVRVPLPGGTSPVCVYAMNASRTGGTSLGCKTYTAAVNPVGHLDTANVVDSSHLQLTGWAFDPDNNGGPGSVVVVIGGVNYPFAANVSRPDVQAAYGLTDATVGYSVTVPIVLGTQDYCVNSPNTVGTGTTTQIACRTVVDMPPVLTKRS
jgi:SpoIID/LytB domain protein